MTSMGGNSTIIFCLRYRDVQVAIDRLGDTFGFDPWSGPEPTPEPSAA